MAMKKTASDRVRSTSQYDKDLIVNNNKYNKAKTGAERKAIQAAWNKKYPNGARGGKK